MAEDRDAVAAVIARINEAWSKGSPEDTSKLWHEDAVIVAPGMQEVARGRASCVQNYVDFLEQATVSDFGTSELSVEVWGDTAVATYSGRITYEREGRAFDERGHEAFVLTRGTDGWQAAWRILLPTAPE